MLADSSLPSTLLCRGFTVARRLQGTPGTCSIFCVRATADTSGELFAAKVVNLAGLDAQGKAAAQQEVSFLKGIAAHPNLIKYRDSFLDETGPSPRLVIVMSFAEDGDLRCVVKERVPAEGRAIPEPVVLSWMKQTLAGLQHMHRQSVLHRDLKSSNVFLSGGRRQLRIGDFGISRMLQSTDFAESCVGTPAYMSPEIMRHEPYDYAADMWALGVICYELCTLRMPFTAASSLLELFVQVTETEPNWEHWTASVALCDMAKHLLLKEARERPTADALLKEALFADTALEVPEELWSDVARQETSSFAANCAELNAACQKTSGSTQSTTIGTDVSPSRMSSSGYLTTVSSDASPSRPMATEQPLNLTLDDFQKMIAAHKEEAANQDAQAPTVP